MADNWWSADQLIAPAVPAGAGGNWWQSDQPAPAAATASAATEAPSLGQRFTTGLADPLVGAAQLGSHLSGGWTPEQLMLPENMRGGPAASDAFVNKREGDYEAQRSAAGDTGFDAARLAGNVLSPMNYIPLAGPGSSLASRVGSGALIGGLSAAQQPVSGDDYFTGKALQTAAGAGTGALLGPLSPAVRGAQNTDAQALKEAGVVLTPGQAGGNVAKAGEAAAYKLPLISSLAKSHQENAIDTFNTAFGNQALRPIGETLPPGTAAGHETATAAREKLNEFYQALMPKLNFAADDPFVAGVAQVEQKLPLETRAEFNRIINPALTDNLSGAELKAVDSDLATWAAKYNKAGAMNPMHDALGEAVDDVRGLMREQMIRTNPESAAQLAAADKSWAMLKIMQKATAGAARDDGKFTPAQSLTAIKNARGTSEQQMAEGTALLQPFASAAQRVIGSSRGSSKAPATAKDLIMAEALQALMTGSAVGGAGANAGAQAGYLPEWAKWGAAAALPALMFTRGGQGLLRAFGPAGPVRQGLGGMLSPAPIGTAAGGLLGGY